MFLTALGRPGPSNFDGKIGMWRMAEEGEAKNQVFNVPGDPSSGIKRKRGDPIVKDITINAEVYFEWMTEEVFPAIVEAYPHAKKVMVQQDGASPHTGKDNVDAMNKVWIPPFHTSLPATHSLPQHTLTLPPAPAPASP